MGVLKVIEFLANRGVDVVSITDPIDTRTAMGKAFIQISLVFAELERNQISERTKAGIAVRRAQGARFGKKHAILDHPKRLARWHELNDASGLDDMTVQEVIDELNRADPKAAKITAQETYRRWRRQGFPGALKERRPINGKDKP